MKIGVIGGGAIGMLVGAHVSLLGHDTTIYVRRKLQKQEIHKHGVILQGENFSAPVKSLLIGEWEKSDIFFVCVKQYHLNELLPLIKKIRSPIVFLQNGMGHLDMIAACKLEQDIIVGTCEHGAIRKNNYTVLHTGKGKVNLAMLKGYNDNVEALCSTLNGKNFPVVFEKEWHPILAKKLIINAVVNPLTGILQVKNGQLLSNPNFKRIAKKICDEASGVLGLNPVKEWDNVFAVIKKTKDNDSSMKIDIQNGRITEIEGIVGYLINHASVDLPYLNFVYETVVALTKD
ncbi:ketopantoate reductase family protein [Aquibacillus rhizosphaerae]|uniref:2-dehydropantoate 2-reductase n=1 Tax=Aquibacillus rhizosphaerae TaxID=3051431 RepID=A0ABT7L5Z6_9BACI|nr:2-dehydropantoate 2-reductase [Aquibacillus sp. LR5S19]MDL4841275.1 2-dehydropantoate 2-reductase [Aquibacillus sp. LR5S19]